MSNWGGALTMRQRVSWSPDDLGAAAPWWDSDNLVGSAPITQAVQRNAAFGASPLLASGGGPTRVASAAYFAGRPAILTSGTDAGLYTTLNFPQPCTWWFVMSWGGDGWSFDSSVSYTGLRLDTGVAWVINSNGFSFGVVSDWTPTVAYGASYLVCITFDGAATSLMVGSDVRALAPGIVDSPDLDECIFGPFPGSPAIDSAWAAGGFVPGGISAPDQASLHAWAMARYGVEP